MLPSAIGAASKHHACFRFMFHFSARTFLVFVICRAVTATWRRVATLYGMPESPAHRALHWFDSRNEVAHFDISYVEHGVNEPNFLCCGVIWPRDKPRCTFNSDPPPAAPAGSLPDSWGIPWIEVLPPEQLRHRWRVDLSSRSVSEPQYWI